MTSIESSPKLSPKADAATAVYSKLQQTPSSSKGRVSAPPQTCAAGRKLALNMVPRWSVNTRKLENFLLSLLSWKPAGQGGTRKLKTQTVYKMKNGDIAANDLDT